MQWLLLSSVSLAVPAWPPRGDARLGRARIRSTIRSTSSTAPAVGVDIGLPELCRQKVVTAEDVERQVAVTVVVAVEEPTFLAPVQRIVSGVEVKH